MIKFIKRIFGIKSYEPEKIEEYFTIPEDKLEEFYTLYENNSGGKMYDKFKLWSFIASIFPETKSDGSEIIIYNFMTPKIKVTRIVNENQQPKGENDANYKAKRMG